MRCPSCNSEIPFEMDVFRKKRCKRCGARLLVSATYQRVLVLLSLSAAEFLLWVANIRALFYPSYGVVFGFLASVWLGFPLGFLILVALVRIAPRVVAPRLVERYWGAITTLDLSGNETVSTDSEEW